MDYHGTSSIFLDLELRRSWMKIAASNQRSEGFFRFKVCNSCALVSEQELRQWLRILVDSIGDKHVQSAMIFENNYES
jgi:hypothetical protein